ncbi:VanZ family protein [Noviherbaspirillum malthae]|uniref:VanZ family protein n=1 Tax=Noviherbaspirillum malthae TaxID=1260987 RepID=UPI00189040FB|nr:VanZ family protein [Noviherbaspirillum malthae]
MKKLYALLNVSAQFQRRSFFSAWVLYGTILLIGSVPGARAEVAQVASGLVLHMAAYSVLTMLLFVGVRGTPAWRGAKAFLWVVAMGAGDEWVQHFWPYRSGTLTDWAIDGLASALTAVALWGICSTLSATEGAASR